LACPDAQGTGRLNLGDATPSTKIVDNLSAFAALGMPAINHSGAVAFLGMTQSGGVSARAIYTGADPVSDRVLGTGELLFGGRIRDIYLGPEGINGQGDLAFFADLVDPTTGAFESSGIYVAIPTPEPSRLVLATLGFIALAAWRLRRR
jgi:hypothetical protein